MLLLIYTSLFYSSGYYLCCGYYVVPWIADVVGYLVATTDVVVVVWPLPQLLLLFVLRQLQ